MYYQQTNGRLDYSHLSMIMHFQKTNVTVSNFFSKEDYIDGSPLREQTKLLGSLLYEELQFLSTAMHVSKAVS